MSSIGQWWMWAGFIAYVLVMLCIDILLLSGKKVHRISMREALGWVFVWFSSAVLFAILLWLYLKHNAPIAVANQRTLEFFTGYLIEKSLSVDNMFVFLMIFNYFVVPLEYQRRVLLFGILGAIIMRLLMILFGIWLVNMFHWILYLFGAFILITGIKMLLFADKETDLSKNAVLRYMRNHLRITHEFREEHFFVRENSLWYVTPLFLVLVLIEISDLIFAIDSIPAIFIITNVPFIVFTSNIFAIFGLRALYFLLANMADRFDYLKYGIALILMFVGIKMLIASWIQISVLVMLGVVVFTLLVCILLSLFIEARKRRNTN